MTHFCVASYGKVLLQCKARGAQQKQLVPLLLQAASPGRWNNYGEDTYSKILNFGQELHPDIVEDAKEVDIDKTMLFFAKRIVPMIDAKKKPQVVLAIKDLIYKDGTIPDETQLGKSRSMYKYDLPGMNEVAFTEFLVDTFLFAVIHTDNADLAAKAFKREMTKDYCKQYDNRVDEVVIYELPQVHAVPTIDKSVNDERFDGVFKQISDEKLHMRNPNELKMFRLDLDGGEFIYDELIRFLRLNIGEYVFSRTRVKEYSDAKELTLMGLEAMDLMKRNGTPGVKNTGNNLGELLIYIFLEHVLQAPKLMSKVEVKATAAANTVVSHCDSMHILTSRGTRPFNQIIFGSSSIRGTIFEAIDAAFDNIDKIKEGRKNEIRLVERTLFNHSFDQQTTQALKAILKPRKAGAVKPSSAYGIFLCYTLDASYDSWDEEASITKAIIDQMESDARKSVNYINKKIAENSLQSHSFYVYLLPLNEALVDHDMIMKDVMH